MEKIYNTNGLVFWDEDEIRVRDMIASHIVAAVKKNLIAQNSAWRFFRVEAPLITPPELIDPNYGSDDVFQTSAGVLRPETTMGSYAYASHLLSSHQRTKLPIVVWQHGKSFRNEQDQTARNMRLKEFYQLEFQCLFAPTTQNDYADRLIPAVMVAIEEMIGPCRLEKSDRLPSYSDQTMDIICDKSNMEVCSISRRNDFSIAKCLEVAVGTDRCVYNFSQRLI